MSPREELEEQGAEIAHELSILRSGTNSAWWHEMREMIEAQMKLRLSEQLLKPCPSLDATLEQEFVKGEYSAFALILRMPELEEERLQGEAQRIEDALRELVGEDTSSGSGTDDGKRITARELFTPDAYGEH